MKGEGDHTADSTFDLTATMAFGVEARVPFLDKEFLRISMGVDAKYKLHKKGETDSDGKPYMEKVSAGLIEKRHVERHC